MKKRILSIIITLAMVLPMLCAFNIVKPPSAKAESSTQNIELDMANGKAYITADKEYTNPVVLFAAYNDDEFVCVSFIYKDLDAGINEINIPDDFSVENANTVKVMVWNNLEDIVPLFEAYEKIKS